MTTHVDASDPFRPPTWRWKLASLLISETEHKPRASDPMVSRVLRFQRRVDDKLAGECLGPSAADDHELTLAHRIWEEAGPLRWVIEARVLARESFDAIAEKCGCAPEVIAIYEQVFFDVVSRLDHQDYIMCSVVEPAWHAGLTENDYPAIWKAFGYMAGPAVLDFLVTGFDGRKSAVGADAVTEFFAADVNAAVRRKALLAARMVPVNEKTAIGILNLYARFMEIEDRAKSVRHSAYDQITTNIDMTLENLNAVFQPNDKLKASTTPAIGDDDTVESSATVVTEQRRTSGVRPKPAGHRGRRNTEWDGKHGTEDGVLTTAVRGDGMVASTASTSGRA